MKYEFTVKVESLGFPMMTAQGQSPGLDSLPPTILGFSLTPQALTLELEVVEEVGVVVIEGWAGVGVKGWEGVVV